MIPTGKNVWRGFRISICLFWQYWNYNILEHTHNFYCNLLCMYLRMHVCKFVLFYYQQETTQKYTKTRQNKAQRLHLDYFLTLVNNNSKPSTVCDIFYLMALYKQQTCHQIYNDNVKTKKNSAGFKHWSTLVDNKSNLFTMGSILISWLRW